MKNLLDAVLSRSPELSEGTSQRFFAEPVLSIARSFATPRMTGREGLRMTSPFPVTLNEVKGLRVT